MIMLWSLIDVNAIQASLSAESLPKQVDKYPQISHNPFHDGIEQTKLWDVLGARAKLIRIQVMNRKCQCDWRDPKTPSSHCTKEETRHIIIGE